MSRLGHCPNRRTSPTTPGNSFDSHLANALWNPPAPDFPNMNDWNRARLRDQFQRQQAHSCQCTSDLVLEGIIGCGLLNTDLSDRADAQVAPDEGKNGRSLPELSDYPDLLRHCRCAESVDISLVVCPCTESFCEKCFLSSLSL